MRASKLHFQRSTETLLGYLQDIACDDHLGDLEIANLQHWLESHHALRNESSHDEIITRLDAILRDSVVESDKTGQGESRKTGVTWGEKLAL